MNVGSEIRVKSQGYLYRLTVSDFIKPILHIDL